MKDIILKYINDQFGNVSNENRHHLSYCHFPEEECTCKNLENIDYDTSLISGGYVDSFSSMAIVVFLQKTFNVKIPSKEISINNLDTINKMADLITRLKQ